MRSLILSIVAFACAAASAAAQDFGVGPAANAELRRMCDDDRGRSWGVDLCGPLLIADPASRRAWASTSDAEGALQPAGAGWVGALPPGVAIANTSLDWAGQRWIMLIAPLPADAEERRVLLAHEAWHRVQAQLGLPQTLSTCAHLESEQGRYLLRLEMRALSVAMRSRNRARQRAAEDALRFRAARMALFANAVFEERALDRNEGLAAFTGVILGANDASGYAARTLDRHDSHEALSRTYAYATGPAYGILADQFRRTWRSELNTGAAPAELLAASLGVSMPSTSALRDAAFLYGGPAIAAEESTRAQTQRTRIAEWRTRFTVSPRVELPLAQMQLEFDPNQVIPIDGLGSFYGVLTLRDAWGEFRATDGAFISTDFTRAILTAPGPDGLSGPGWSLSLAPGYRLAAAGADGAYRPLFAPQAE